MLRPKPQAELRNARERRSAKSDGTPIPIQPESSIVMTTSSDDPNTSATPTRLWRFGERGGGLARLIASGPRATPRNSGSLPDPGSPPSLNPQMFGGCAQRACLLALESSLQRRSAGRAGSAAHSRWRRAATGASNGRPAPVPDCDGRGSSHVLRVWCPRRRHSSWRDPRAMAGSLTAEFEGLQAKVTATLQSIDANFSRANDLAAEMFPLVRDFVKQLASADEASAVSKFWPATAVAVLGGVPAWRASR